ncbi:hypothetical protein K2173_006203 [Erythroxylum novogranatense]|uniref:Uncharacterized protein n=1 Tax=Erythroxylum novogranatense TaxID=1862640 RepID=A0AAV8TED3_9ROSI|nr:hypothetical protein K2173_006203 [Erythroxylum novogranatense]
MAAFSSKPANSYTVRSIKNLKNICNLESSSSSSKGETICTGLSGLGEIYRCTEDLINLPLTQQALEQQEDGKWVSGMLDDLISYLDICATTRDAVLLIKESVNELQSALRRSKCGSDSAIETSISAYISSRKRMKKEASRCLTSLKQRHNKFGEYPLPNADHHHHHHLSALVRVLTEVSLVTIFIFDSLFSFFSVPMALSLGPVNENMNELESVDSALNNVSSKDSYPQMSIQIAQKKLEVLDMRIEDFDMELERLFRDLIHTRVSLLNVLSH